jgi:hypothetical protein
MHRLGEFAPPVVVKVPSTPDQGPWWTTNTTGQLVKTHMKEGFVMQAFFECSIENEDEYLTRFYGYLSQLGSACESLAEGIAAMKANGLTPRHVVMPYTDLDLGMTSREVDLITLSKGCITEVDGIRFLSAREALPKGSALLFAERSDTGFYTRVSDFLAVTVFRADRSVLMIRSNVA